MRRLVLYPSCILLLLFLASGGLAQPPDHAKHHPGGSENSNGPAGMMDGGMDGMMEKMGAPKPKDLYPSLMNLPELSPEKRLEVLEQADQRMKSGTTLMGKGLDQIARATSRDGYAEMQEGVALTKEGLARFDSGLAAKRALSEGKAPRKIALEWFKREMNLLPPDPLADQGRFGGVTFHLFVIVLLGAFSAAMIGMYFFKMKRAAQLLERLTSQTAVDAPEVKPGENESAQVVPPAKTLEEKSEKLTIPPSFPVMKSKTQPENKWSGRLRVCRIFDETPGVKTFRLASEDEVALPFTYYPGQFLTLSLKIGGKTVRRSYTIASTPTQLHYCALTIKREEQGLVSRYLHDEIKEGDVLEVSGPNGKFTFTGEESDSLVLISGGVGITPMMSVVRYLTDIGWTKDIYFLYCCRTTNDFIFREELEQLQERHGNLHVFATMTRAAGTVWMGLKGRFTAQLFSHLLPDLTERRYHVCGPPEMMVAVLEMLDSLGVPKEQVKTEAFGPARKPKVVDDEAPRQAATSVVTFKKSGKSASLGQGQTVLDLADELGVEIDNSCRSGQCGLCRVKLLSGKVEMECDDSLTDEDKAQGLILACQATAGENIEVDA